MKIGEEATYFGTAYMAVSYNEKPAEFMPSEDDAQCKICALMPNYCEMSDKCHGTPAFIFVKSRFIKAMSQKLY